MRRITGTILYEQGRVSDLPLQLTLRNRGCGRGGYAEGFEVAVVGLQLERVRYIAPALIKNTSIASA